MKVHNLLTEATSNGVQNGSGLIHLVKSTVANVHDITYSSDLLHVD